MRSLAFRFLFGLMAIAVFGSASRMLHAQTSDDLFSPAQWQKIDSSVEGALSWLAAQQKPDGSFPTLDSGQPAVTSLCVMAFVAHGHMPGEGPYGTQLERALDFIVGCQKRNGLLSLIVGGRNGRNISRNIHPDLGSTPVYNHALSALLLSELFAMEGRDLEKRQETIERALQATLEMQRWPKYRKGDRGGWRYLDITQKRYDSDLSVTGWHLMFMRSAKNAGFEVPQKSVEDAVGYVRRCFQPRHQTFMLLVDGEGQRSRGMAGAGILALAHAGMHDSKEARAAGNWLLHEGFPTYNEIRNYSRRRAIDDRYHYGVFCASQAMYQLGGEPWRKFFPATVKVILENQSTSGSWAAENHDWDNKFGNAYTTALMVLTLGAPNQLLPIFQR